MKIEKKSYVKPSIWLVTGSSKGNDLMAVSGKYGINVDGKEEASGKDAKEENPDEIDAKQYQSWGTWDE